MKIGCTQEQVWDEWLRIYWTYGGNKDDDNHYDRALDVFYKYGKGKGEGITDFLEKCTLNVLSKIYYELKKL